MANLYDISPLSYQPSTNMDWFTKAIFGGVLIEKGKITPITGVKESTLLNLLELTDNVLQPDGRDCGWTPNQIAKLSDKELKIKTYKINLEQCIDDLERKRTVWMLSPGAKNTELPNSLEEATMTMLATELSKEIETKIFGGDSSTPGNFDGAVKVLLDSDESIKMHGIELNTDNVLDEITKVYLKLPEDVKAQGMENGSLAIYVSYNTLTLAKVALSKVFNGNVVINPNFSLNGDTVYFLGIEIVPVRGIGQNNIILADVNNFILGTDLLSDLEEMRLGQFPAPNDNKIFVDGRLRLGFVIPFEDEVVFYSPDNVVITP